MRPRLAVADVLPLLEVLGATDAVLIGGQAVQVWCDRYAKALEPLRAIAPLTSGDVDVQGDRRVVEVCASAFATRAAFPKSIEDATNVGYVDVPLGSARVGVNVLSSPYGVRAREALETALVVDLAGGVSIRVLHPVLCMESRFANIAGLGRTDPKELHQARASIVCAREYIVELAAGGDVRDALALVERVFRFASRGRHARAVFAAHGLDAFAAVTPHVGLPDRFRTTRYPQMCRIIAASRVRPEPP